MHDMTWSARHPTTHMRTTCPNLPNPDPDYPTQPNPTRSQFHLTKKKHSHRRPSTQLLQIHPLHILQQRLVPLRTPNLRLRNLPFLRLFRPLARPGHDLAEAGVLAVLLVVVVARLRFELGGNLFEHDGEDAVFGLVVGAVAVPDGDEVRVEADGHGEAAEVVAC